jgi:hypothetical protein
MKTFGWLAVAAVMVIDNGVYRASFSAADGVVYTPRLAGAGGREHGAVEGVLLDPFGTPIGQPFVLATRDMPGEAS